MNALTEAQIEEYQLQLLQNLGYSYCNGYDIQPEGSNQERESFGEIILKHRLTQSISRINPTIPHDAQYQAQREIFNIASSDLLNNNEIFHKYLTEGITVLVERIRQNTSIDWNLKESVRSRMKIAVKRLLRKYGYPPDMEALAMELVLEQAKVFTEFEVSTQEVKLGRGGV